MPSALHGPAPLVVISHGTGGWYRGHVDTAEALAARGFIVAALTHSGDNGRDRSRAFAIWRRSADLTALVDHMLLRWSGRALVDPQRIGAFGFSAGGFTVLVAAGGKPDLTRMSEYCRANPRGVECGLGSRAPAWLLRRVPWAHDARLRAIVVAAPALGYSFGREGLSGVRIPVQLWRAEQDQVLPHPYSADAVRRALPSPSDYRVVRGAGHHDFLTPCGRHRSTGSGDVCASRPGFDRTRFHQEMNAAVGAFFREALTAPGPSASCGGHRNCSEPAEPLSGEPAEPLSSQKARP